MVDDDDEKAIPKSASGGYGQKMKEIFQTIEHLQFFKNRCIIERNPAHFP